MAMLLRTDPFRELDLLTQRFFGTPVTATRAAVVPMDAYRTGDDYVVAFDLPGVSADSIDVDVKHNVLTVKAERTADYGDGAEVQVRERPRGVFSRQIFLGDTLDTENVSASYDAGVLTLRIPISEQAKSRKITVGGDGDHKAITN